MAEQQEGTLPRENMRWRNRTNQAKSGTCRIETAVKFLQNPKVRDSPFSSRKSFLKNKGLTDEEIDIAIGKSGTGGDEALQQQQHETVKSSGQALTRIGSISSQPIESKWTRVKDYTATAIVLGGISYVIYVIYKKYIVPHFYGPSREEQQFQQLTQSITQLQQTMADVVRTMEETQRILSQQQGNLQQIASSSSSNRGSSDLTNMQDSHSINELKEEIKSIKGLLLNRKQFPQATPSTPVIPSWQLTATTTSNQTAANTNKSEFALQKIAKEISTDTDTETPTLQNGTLDSKSDDEELFKAKTPEMLTKETIAEEEQSENQVEHKKDVIFSSERQSEDNTQIQKHEASENNTEDSVVTE